MKHLISYNESIRDKMTPKSSEEIQSILKNKTPNEIFQIGVKLGDSEIVRSAFEKDININIVYPELTSIVLGDKLDIVKTILEYQPQSIYRIIKAVIENMNFRPQGSMADNRMKLESYIVLSDIPQQEILDKSLIYLCHFDSGNSIRLLFHMGADIHQDNEEPLMQSVYNGRSNSVKTLLSLGADPTINHNRPLEEAKRRHYDDIADIISNHISKLPLRKKLSRYIPFLRESVRDMMTPKSSEEIQRAVLRKYSIKPEVFQFLTNKGYKFSKEHQTAYRDRWRTTLAFSNEEGKNFYFLPNDSLDQIKDRFKLQTHHKKMNESIRDKMVGKSDKEIMLSLKGKEPNQRLLLCAINGHLEGVKNALEDGADIHFRNDKALGEASKEGHIEIVKYLLNNGADVHGWYDYAMKWASNNDHLEIVRILTEHGADVNTGNGDPLRSAIIHKNKELEKYLVDNGAIPEKVLYWAAGVGAIDVTKYLFNNYPDIDIHYNDESILDYAVLMGYRGEIKLLLKYGADPDRLNSESKRDFEEIVKSEKEEEVYEGIRDKMTPKSEQQGLDEFKKLDKSDMVNTLYSECIEMFDPNPPLDSTPVVTDGFCDFLKKEVGFNVWTTFLPEFRKYINYDMVLEDLTEEQLIKLFQLIYNKKVNESIRDKMTPKYVDYSKIRPEKILSQSIKMDLIEGFRYLVENGLVEGETKYIIEKCKLGLHKDETRDYEEWFLDQLTGLDVFRSENNPYLLIYKKGDDVLFDYEENNHTFWFDYTKTYKVLVYRFKINREIINMFVKFMVNSQWKNLKIRANTVCHTMSLLTESIRDKMTPKSEEEINRAISDMKKHIADIVRANDGFISMIQLDDEKSIVYDDREENLIHTIETFYEDHVDVEVYDIYTQDPVDEYEVKYDDLSPDFLTKIKKMLDDGVKWESINDVSED